MELVLVALATFVVWEYFGTVSPFKISSMISPVIVSALAYGLTFVDHRILVAVAATGGAALLHRLIMSEQEERPRFALQRKAREGRVTPPGVGSRIPKL